MTSDPHTVTSAVTPFEYLDPAKDLALKNIVCLYKGVFLSILSVGSESAEVLSTLIEPLSLYRLYPVSDSASPVVKHEKSDCWETERTLDKSMLY